ncbi:uracil-DNA glycosylase [Culicoidibacter larvae]|uniref:Uracil-DNA glycosylase n=1 Tax=Culicoidibacter larvae TaxID=2579976 RepID=A0A5R8QH29_9FIRM|nr:uracil-DNA glycosylase [Culicoidibacter larvae]TLG77298.1 uracil-DNA glycosylase [Culicoidibacter larvae]
MKSKWQALLRAEKEQEYFKGLWEFVKQEYRSRVIYPPKEQIFHAFDLVDYDEVNVVILGQDPYHGPHQAHGLSFSIASPLAKFPPSLRNMFIELESDLGIHRENANLTDWAEQGVLLLNTVLTVRAGQAASHRGHGWEQFTDKVIRLLNERDEQIIFVLWGNDARRKTALITNPKHKIIQGVHPSPLSADKGFFGSKPYSKVNQFLTAAQKTPIQWG